MSIPIVHYTKFMLSLIKGEEFKTIFYDAVKNAALAGEYLALLIASDREFSGKNINLIGFSLGTHVIHKCLNTLYKLNKMDRIKNVVLMGGATNFRNREKLKEYVSKVKGRIINVFSKKDRILSILYKISMRKTPIGMEEIDELINVEVSYGHTEYRENMDLIFIKLKKYLII
jgi:hypothetical protein